MKGSEDEGHSPEPPQQIPAGTTIEGEAKKEKTQ
jgi:hypothetical protein